MMDRSCEFFSLGLHLLDSTSSHHLRFAGLSCWFQRLLARFFPEGLAEFAVLRNFISVFGVFDGSSAFFAEFSVFWGHILGFAGFRSFWDCGFHVLATALCRFDFSKRLLQGDFILVAFFRFLILGGNVNILIENLFFLELNSVWNHFLLSLWMVRVQILGFVLLWLSGHFLFRDIECLVLLLRQAELSLIGLHIMVSFLGCFGPIGGLHYLAALLALFSLLHMLDEGLIILLLQDLSLGRPGLWLWFRFLLKSGLEAWVLRFRNWRFHEANRFFLALRLVGLDWIVSYLRDFLIDDFLSTLGVGETCPSDILGEVC